MDDFEDKPRKGETKNDTPHSVTENNNSFSTTGEYPVTEQMEGEEEVDEELVARAYTRIETVFVEKMNDIMEEVGGYLLGTFFDGDAARARMKKPAREKSFYRLTETLRSNHAHAPSMSWLYNAVNVAADKILFEKKDPSLYPKLGITHKVYLTQVRDFETKSQIAEEAANGNLSTRELKERINRLKKKRTSLDLENLYTPEAQEILSGKRPVELRRLLETIRGKRKETKKFQRDIESKLSVKIAKYEESIKAVEKEIRKRSRKKPS